MVSCDKCKHWRRDTRADVPTHGTCQAVKHIYWPNEQQREELLAYVEDGSGYHAALRTRAEFSCSLFVDGAWEWENQSLEDPEDAPG